MKLFYSGTCSDMALPEAAVRQYKPDIMFTFWDFSQRNGSAMRRLKRCKKNRHKK